MPFARYRRIGDLPDEIAVFPLRGTILLPRANLPLNIFEPRYLAMIDQTLAGNRLIGIIQPKGTDGEESPADNRAPLKSVGCAGRVTAFQELDNGRIAISLTGIARFRLKHERDAGEPFRIFAADFTEFQNDLSVGNDEQDVDRDKLLEVLRNFLDARKLQADWQAINNAPTEFLVNSLSTISPFGPEEKQALLEAETLSKRAEVLATLATMELASDDRTGGSVQ